MNKRTFILATVFALAAPIPGLAAAEPAPASPYARWTNGPPATPEFFPIAVWLQPPSKAQRYREAGFNTYVGLWKGPTEEQLAALKQAGMKVICGQNEVGLRHRDDPAIIGWMHGDEPDNAQSLGSGKGYGPPILPEKIVADYRRLRAADSSRPVLLNLGQGVAWDQYIGRGVRRNHPEDYPEYVRGCDIASFDIYPVVHDSPEIAGKLWFVARGVERLVTWAGPDKPAWNCIECTRISSRTTKATPQQVRAEVWMSLIHGSRGLVYFVHEWQPRFDESALLNDPEMLSAVTAINRQITQLAPVLNTPTIKNGVTVTTDNRDVPVATMLKHHGGATWLFTVAMRAGATTARFTVNGWKGEAAVEVLGEDRKFTARGGEFTDTFQPWQTHLYRLTAKTAQ